MRTAIRTAVKTKLACEIAGINSDRFKEAVHVGNYPCAPATTSGSSRIFQRQDLIALVVYGGLLRKGFAPLPSPGRWPVRSGT